jgi:4-hydroxy-tetrahydrodipicolinate reductase
MTLRIAIHGATGRMGQRLVALTHADPHLTLAAAIASPTSRHLGTDAGTLAGIGPIGVPITAALAEPVQVVIDFSTPTGTRSALHFCRTQRVPIVIATTGHTADERGQLDVAAQDVAVLVAPNTSLVVNLLFKLTQLTATALRDKDFDVEIIERHHRFKKDSPSGTAAHFARIVQTAMEQRNVRHGREGLLGERPRHEIGMHAIRAGDNVGEHTLVFSTLGETLELVHKGYSRDSYARGALQAAQFLADKPFGTYTMADVLGL